MVETSPVLSGKTIVRSEKRAKLIDFAEIWEFRELFLFLVWRDVKVRYKQTILGVGWAVVPPIVTMLVFTVIFGNIAEISSDGIPYPVFSFVALVPWTFFRNNLTTASTSIVSNAHMVTKVYFPRIVLPIAAVLSGLVDFVISFTLLMVLVFGYILYGVYNPDTEFLVALSVNLIALPFFMLLAMAISLGVGLWLATANAQYRDVRHGTPFVMQIWLWITPIAYSSNELSAFWKPIYAMNPMVSVVEGFRWAFFGTEALTWPMLIVSIAVATLVLFSGTVYFQRVQDSFADVV